MVQVFYGDGALCVRKAVADSEAADISGDYNIYDTQDTLTVDGLDDKAMTAPSPDFPTSLLPGGSILSPFRCLLAAFAALAEALPSSPRSCEAAAQRAAPNRRRSPPPCPSPRRAPPIGASWRRSLAPSRVRPPGNGKASSAASHKNSPPAYAGGLLRKFKPSRSSTRTTPAAAP